MLLIVIIATGASDKEEEQVYCIQTKYSDNLTPYHTSPKMNKIMKKVSR